MKLQQHDFKAFLKNPFLCVALVLLFVGEITYLISSLTYQFVRQPLDGFRSILKLSIIVFVFFMFASYEFFVGIKQSGLQECVKGTKQGFLKLLLGRLVVLLTFCLTNWMVIFAFFVKLFFLSNVKTGEFFLHIFKISFAYFFAVPVIGILFGMVLFLAFKRIFAYLAMLLFVLIASPFGEVMGETVYGLTNINIFPFLSLFNLFPLNLITEVNGAIGQPFAGYQAQQLLFWIFASVALIAYKMSEKRRKPLLASSAVCVGIGAMCLFFFALPKSTTLMNGDPKWGCNADGFYLSEHENEQKVEDGGFEVTSYKISLKFGRQLSAETEMTVSRSDLSEYKFSLYRNYKLKNVTDQSGKKLEFTQDGNYFLVKNPGGGDIKSIKIQYSGANPRYYANKQGVALPGFSLYYPFSGYREIFLGGGSYNKMVLDKPVDFEMTINSKQKVYTNLVEGDDGVFRGVTDGVNLYSGFLHEKDVKGVKVVYSYLECYEYTDEKVNKLVTEFIDSSEYKSGTKTIFVYPRLNQLSIYELCTGFTDAIATTSLHEMAETYRYQRMSRDKYNFEGLLTWYNDDKTFEKILASESINWDKTPIWLKEATERVGKEKVLEICNEFINNDEDTRTVEEMLKSIQ